MFRVYVDLLDLIMMAIICDTEGSALTMYSHGTTIVGEKKVGYLLVSTA